MDYSCTQCGTGIAETKEHQRYVYRKTGRIYCTVGCGYQHRHEHRTYSARSDHRLLPIPCTTCCKPADLSGRRLGHWKATGRAYCSRECCLTYVSQRSSVTMAKTNRVHASARMKVHNPMRHEDVRQRMSQALRAIGHRPVKRGGNGRPPTIPEGMLYLLLKDEGYVLNAAVRTGLGRGSGYPNHYKPDLAHLGLKISIEADGNTHNGKRKVLDAKKDRFLAGLGWTTLRFTNDEIVSDPVRVWETIASITSRLRAFTPTSPTA